MRPVNPIDLMDSSKRIEQFFGKVHAAGAAAAVRGRRPPHHPADFPCDRARASGRHDPFRCPFRHQRPLFRRQSLYPRHALSAARSKKGCSIPSASCRSASAARSMGPATWSLPKARACASIYMEEFCKLGEERVIAEASRVVGDGPTYISFDVDGLDPVYAPGTGTPEIGGMTHARGAAYSPGLARAQPHRRRRCRGVAAVRSERQHRPGRRHPDVRDHVLARRCRRAPAGRQRAAALTTR